jgi:hypothetical protein
MQREFLPFQSLPRFQQPQMKPLQKGPPLSANYSPQTLQPHDLRRTAATLAGDLGFPARRWRQVHQFKRIERSAL